MTHPIAGFLAYLSGLAGMAAARHTGAIPGRGGFVAGLGVMAAAGAWVAGREGR